MQAHADRAATAQSARTSLREDRGAPATSVDDVAMRRAAGLGDISRMQALVERRVDVNGRDGAGRTPLLIAVQRGHAEAVDFLLTHGADANVADSGGTTPLQAARAAG
jgi:uncharacterized protein